MHISGDFKERAKNAGLAFVSGGALTGSLLLLLQAAGVPGIKPRLVAEVAVIAAIAWAARSVDNDLQHDHAPPAAPDRS